MNTPTKTLKNMIEQLCTEMPRSLSTESEVLISLLAVKLILWARLTANNVPDAGLLISRDMLTDPSKASAAINDVSCLNQTFDETFRRYDGYKDCINKKMIELLLHWKESGLLDRKDFPEQLRSAVSRIQDKTYLPLPLAQLLSRCVGLEPKMDVYCPWDWSAQSAQLIAAAGANAYVEGAGQNDPAWILSLEDPSFHVQPGMPIQAPNYVENGELNQFDVGVALPPLGIKSSFLPKNDLFGRFPGKVNSWDTSVARHLLAQVRGKIAFLTTPGLQYKAGAEKELRKELVKCGQVETIIALRAGLLPEVTVELCVFVLNRAGGCKTVRFIDATKDELYQRIDRRTLELREMQRVAGWVLCDAPPLGVGVDVPVEDIAANDYDLSVSRYVLSDDSMKLDRYLEAQSTKSLGQLVQFVRPLPKKKDPAESIEVYEFTIGSLPDCGYLVQPDNTVSVDAEGLGAKHDSYLSPGDILISVKGTIGAVGLVGPDAPEPGSDRWIAGQTMLILRPIVGVGVDPRFLYMQLKSPLGQLQLQRMVQGTSIPSIRLNELKKFQVVLPDGDEGETAIEAFEEEVRLNQQMTSLLAKQAELLAGIWPID